MRIPDFLRSSSSAHVINISIRKQSRDHECIMDLADLLKKHQFSLFMRAVDSYQCRKNTDNRKVTNHIHQIALEQFFA